MSDTYTCEYMYTCTCPHMNMHTQRHIHVHIHTRVHTHEHLQWPQRQRQYWSLWSWSYSGQLPHRCLKLPSTSPHILQEQKEILTIELSFHSAYHVHVCTCVSSCVHTQFLQEFVVQSLSRLIYMLSDEL